MGLADPSAQEPPLTLFLGSVCHLILAVLAQCCVLSLCVCVALCVKATCVKLKLFLMFQIQNHWIIVQLSLTQANEGYICIHFCRMTGQTVIVGVSTDRRHRFLLTTCSRIGKAGVGQNIDPTALVSCLYYLHY